MTFTVTERAKLVRVVMATSTLTKQEKMKFCEIIRHSGKKVKA